MLAFCFLELERISFPVVAFVRENEAVKQRAFQQFDLIGVPLAFSCTLCTLLCLCPGLLRCSLATVSVAVRK